MCWSIKHNLPWEVKCCQPFKVEAPNLSEPVGRECEEINCSGYFIAGLPTDWLGPSYHCDKERAAPVFLSCSKWPHWCKRLSREWHGQKHAGAAMVGIGLMLFSLCLGFVVNVQLTFGLRTWLFPPKTEVSPLLTQSHWLDPDSLLLASLASSTFDWPLNDVRSTTSSKAGD